MHAIHSSVGSKFNNYADITIFRKHKKRYLVIKNRNMINRDRDKFRSHDSYHSKGLKTQKN